MQVVDKAVQAVLWSSSTGKNVLSLGYRKVSSFRCLADCMIIKGGSNTLETEKGDIHHPKGLHTLIVILSKCLFKLLMISNLHSVDNYLTISKRKDNSQPSIMKAFPAN